VRLVKLVILLIVWTLLFLAAALVRLWIYLWRPKNPWRIVSRMTRRFVALIRMIVNVRITLQGDLDLLDIKGAFIASNHLGYLDGFVLGSLFPTIFVSKREVRSWPIIGWWTALCGTVYIDRERKGKITLVVEEIVERLNQKANILIFPEGTSTNGDHLLPFQSAPFAAPLRAHAPIMPLTITYRRINGAPVTDANRDTIYWYGDMDFMTHFWKLLAMRNIEVTVKFHAPIDTSRYKNSSVSRKQLSQACYSAIASGLQQDRKNLRAPLTLS
jgi:1-acyl-sn-glycerol-3-phosphate acyltransferase